MYLTFSSEGHETKTFTKNLIDSEYKTKEDIPTQVKELFFPIGQDGVERENAYTDQGLFFKLGVIIKPMERVLKSIEFGVLAQKPMVEIFKNNTQMGIMPRFGLNLRSLKSVTKLIQMKAILLLMII